MKNFIISIIIIASIFGLYHVSSYAYTNSIKGMCQEHIENYQQYPDYFVTEIDRNECQSYGYKIPQV